jgi:hypothetical protein
MPNGDGGSGFSFDPNVFFGGILDTIIAVINAIISALVYLFNLLVEVFKFLYGAVVAIANVLVRGVKLIARGFIHVIKDIFHGHFIHLYEDYLKLKARLAEILGPVLRILKRIRALYNQFVLKPLLNMIHLIQQLRQFLVIFRILGFKWAAKLDALLAKQEQRLIKNVLVIQAWINFAISVIDLMIDPSLILRKNFLLASLLSYLGAIKRVVFFGANRTQSTDEVKQSQRDRTSLAPKTALLQSGFAETAQYHPTLAGINSTMNGMQAKYAQDGTFV